MFDSYWFSYDSLYNFINPWWERVMVWEYNFIMDRIYILPVKKSVTGEELQAHASGCWGLFPAFCRYPNDTHKKFHSVAKFLLPCIRKDAYMLENIAIALQVMSLVDYVLIFFQWNIILTSVVLICILPFVASCEAKHELHW